MKKTLLLSIYFIASTAFNAHANPSKEDTYNFIVSKIPKNQAGTIYAYSTEDYCKIIQQTSNQYISTTTTFNLKDFDPTRVEMSTGPNDSMFGGYYSVRINTKSSQNKIMIDRVKTDGEKTHEATYQTGVEVENPGSLNAEKVKKAFIHLITECGGSKELF